MSRVCSPPKAASAEESAISDRLFDALARFSL
jgi:hypothetical protein